jgi:hypothetical protein
MELQDIARSPNQVIMAHLILAKQLADITITEPEKNGQFSCVFFLTGKFKSFSDKSILIDTYYPGESNDNIKGIVNCKSNNEFNILLNDDHGGCWNVQKFKDDPVEFVLQKNEAWIDIKVIKSDKSYFYSEPDETKKCKTYVIKGDCVKVMKRSGNWIKVVYESKTNTVGWIKAQDCY